MINNEIESIKKVALVAIEIMATLSKKDALDDAINIGALTMVLGMEIASLTKNKEEQNTLLKALNENIIKIIGAKNND